jgi:hypothetical protein
MDDSHRTRPGRLRHPFITTHQGLGHLQADWQPARGADPSWPHQDRKARFATSVLISKMGSHLPRGPKCKQMSTPRLKGRGLLPRFGNRAAPLTSPEADFWKRRMPLIVNIRPPGLLNQYAVCRTRGRRAIGIYPGPLVGCRFGVMFVRDAPVAVDLTQTHS